MAGCGSSGGMGSAGSAGSKDGSPRRKATKAERLRMDMADASTSGIVPLMGFAILAFILVAIARLIL